MPRMLWIPFAISILLVGCGPDPDPPTPTVTPATGTAGDRPVILVPGVAGSQLVDGDSEVWAAVSDQILSLSDDFLLSLSLADDGTAGDSGITYGNIMRRASIEIAGIEVKEADFYGSLIERFESAGYAEGELLFIFPYDWRIDIRTEAERLRTLIDEVRDRTGSDRVDIVAHSMGGLVTLDALQNPSMDGKVGRVVTLGTPVLGATKALGVLEYKALCFTEEILDRHCITNPSTAQRVMNNFPTGYQLLPSRDFEHAVGSPLEIEGTDASYDEWSNVVRNNRNTTLFDSASSWQSGLSVRPHDPEVEMLRVVGSDRSTPVQIERFSVHDCFIFSAGFCPEKTVTKIIAGPGDGTVPRASASLYDEDRDFDQREGALNHYVAGVSHMGLAQNEDVFNEVLAFLNDEPEARIASVASVDTAAMAINDDPAPFNGLTVTIIGPAWGTIESERGEVTGPVIDNEPDTVYEGIPGSEFWRSNNAQTFAFSDPGSHFARFTVPPADSPEYSYLRRSTAPDEFVSDVILIEIDRYREANIEDTAIYRVEPSAGMALEFSFDVRDDPDEVQVFIDRDGDDQYDGEAVEVANREPLQAGDPTSTPTATIESTATATATATVSPTPTATSTATPEPVTRQLLRLGPDNELRPDIITEWEISDNGDLIAIQIQEDLTLANGAPLVSETLIEIIEEHREEFIQYEYIGSRPVDDSTLTIVLDTTAGEAFLIEIADIEVIVLE